MVLIKTQGKKELLLVASGVFFYNFIHINFIIFIILIQLSKDFLVSKTFMIYFIFLANTSNGDNV